MGKVGKILKYAGDVVVFDLETQNSFQDVGGRHNLAKLRVSLAGAYSYARDEFLSFREEEMPALGELLKQAALVVGFNIRGFDYPVLDPYLSFDPMGLPSLDIMQEITTRVGYRVSLDSVAEATLNKTKNGDGLEAIRLFRAGEWKKLEKYCLMDVRLTRDILNYGRKNGKISFSSNYGDYKSVRVNWRFPGIFPESEKPAGKTPKGGTLTVDLDGSELAEIYEALALKSLIDQRMEKQIDTEIAEKIGGLLMKNQSALLQERASEALGEFEDDLVDSIDDDDRDGFDEESFGPRFPLSGKVLVDEGMERAVAQAFRERRRVEISYEAVSSPAGEPFKKTRQVDIYRIEGGYIEGYCHLRQDTRMFRLDRVSSLKKLDVKYKIPKGWDIK